MAIFFSDDFLILEIVLPCSVISVIFISLPVALVIVNSFDMEHPDALSAAMNSIVDAVLIKMANDEAERRHSGDSAPVAGVSSEVQEDVGRTAAAAVRSSAWLGDVRDVFINEGDHFRLVVFGQVVAKGLVVAVSLLRVGTVGDQPQEQIAIAKLGYLKK